MRIAIWVESLLGYGHAVRMHALLQMVKPQKAMIISGSVAQSSYLKILFETYTVVNLPPIAPADVTKPYPATNEIGQNIAEVWSERKAKIDHAIKLFQPTHLLVEHFPIGRHGFAREIEEMVATLKACVKNCQIFSSVRDFGGGHPLQNTYELKMRHWLTLFDKILIHGRKEIFNASILYPQLDQIDSKIIYTGYLYHGKPFTYNQSGSWIFDLGGGFNADHFIKSSLYTHLRTSFSSSFIILKGVHAHRHEQHYTSGDALGDEVKSSIIYDGSKDELKTPGISFMVCRSGYNSGCEVLLSNLPTLMIPHAFSFEQQLRATMLHQLRRAVCIDESDINTFASLRSNIANAIEMASNWRCEEYDWMFADHQAMNKIFHD